MVIISLHFKGIYIIKVVLASMILRYIECADRQTRQRFTSQVFEQ